MNKTTQLFKEWKSFMLMELNTIEVLLMLMHRKAEVLFTAALLCCIANVRRYAGNIIRMFMGPPHDPQRERTSHL